MIGKTRRARLPDGRDALAILVGAALGTAGVFAGIGTSLAHALIACGVTAVAWLLSMTVAASRRSPLGLADLVTAAFVVFAALAVYATIAEVDVARAPLMFSAPSGLVIMIGWRLAARPPLRRAGRIVDDSARTHSLPSTPTETAPRSTPRE